MSDESEVEQANETAAVIRAAMHLLAEQNGFHPAAIIAGAHAEAVAAMVVAYGGAEAAERLRAAAAQVELLPSLAAARLAATAPAGTA